jgi:hypothetical protein
MSVSGTDKITILQQMLQGGFGVSYVRPKPRISKLRSWGMNGRCDWADGPVVATGFIALTVRGTHRGDDGLDDFRAMQPESPVTRRQRLPLPEARSQSLALAECQKVIAGAARPGGGH